jgi:hypothetical protein
VRILIEASAGFGNADRPEESESFLSGLFSVHPQVVAERSRDLATNLHDGIERRHRVLEYHGDLTAPVSAHLRWRERCEILALEDDTAFEPEMSLREQADDRSGQYGLSRARFTDDAERATTVEHERHSVDGTQWPVWGVEMRL